MHKKIPALILITALSLSSFNGFTSHGEYVNDKYNSSKNEYHTQGKYVNLYPDMYVTPPTKLKAPKKTVYLTFDDGPTSLNSKFLTTLKDYNVKATFFVVGSVFDNKEGKKRLKAIYDEGHTIGVHCYSHDYYKTYASTEAYLKDFYKVYKLIYQITGEKPTVFRFPGGSNTGYNANIRKAVIAEMNRRGFVYYDWNVTAGDTSPKSTPNSITTRLVRTVNPRIHNIVLAHDINYKTSEALPGVLRQLTQKGYKFHRLTNDVKPYQFSK